VQQATEPVRVAYLQDWDENSRLVSVTDDEDSSQAPGPLNPSTTSYTHDGLDLPDEEFDYEDFVAREFGHRTSKAIRIRWYWVVTAVVVAVTLLTLVLAGVW
jgi:YD repeat-containing protein